MAATVPQSSPKPKRKGPIAGVEQFNLDLFLELNEEYRDKPIIPAPRGQNNSARSSWAEKWAEKLDARIGLRGKRVLEVGCGRGDLSRTLAEKYDCKVVGVDIKNYPTWEENSCDNLQLVQADISAEHDLPVGEFDCIISLVVWEHVNHPFAMLKTCSELLADDGTFYLRANLHRGATASHRYRDIFFPWPHLLFDDAVFLDFYRHMGKFPKGPAWVNKLTYAQYLLYFSQLDLRVEREWLTQHKLDRDFYERFEEQLSKYPVFDLTTEFFDVVLKKNVPEPEEVAQQRQAYLEDSSQQWATRSPQAELIFEQLSSRLPEAWNAQARGDILDAAVKELAIQLAEASAELSGVKDAHARNLADQRAFLQAISNKLPLTGAAEDEILRTISSRIYRAAGLLTKLRRRIGHVIRAAQRLYQPTHSKD